MSVYTIMNGSLSTENGIRVLPVFDGLTHKCKYLNRATRIFFFPFHNGTMKNNTCLFVNHVYYITNF